MKTSRKDIMGNIRAYPLSALCRGLSTAVGFCHDPKNYPYRWNWDSGSCHLLDCSPFGGKYHQTKGTHCWFCEREFGVDKQIWVCGGQSLIRTREHIIPKTKIIYGHERNYIATCKDCNCLKGSRNAREFAQYLQKLIETTGQGFHNMWKYLPIMRDRAWKLYNKTSKFHREYEEVGFEKAKERLLKKYQS